MKPRIRASYFGLMAFCLSRIALAQSSIDASLGTVDSLYKAGSYALAELESRRILDNELVSDSIRTVAQQWVAFALIAQDRPAPAKEHFLAILRRHPSHELDPLRTSPKILAVFNDARATTLAARTEERDSIGERIDAVPGGITFRTIVFPGWEQWYQGRTSVGSILVGAGVATLGAGIVFEFLRSSARKDYLAATTPDAIAANYDTYNLYSKAETYSFVAFGVVYLLSEIDVFTHASPVSLTATHSPSPAGTCLALRFALP